MTIGQIAKTVGVNVQTIRYYEKIRLLPKPKTRESGYRRYSMDDVQRLNFVRRSKDAGFSLKEISRLLALRIDTKSTCSDVRHITEHALHTVEAKLAELTRFHAALRELMELCTSETLSASACPILDLLEKNSKGSM